MTILDALKILAQLFFTFFTTGLFTIGGGQAMIGLLETELVNNLGWIDFETFQNFVTVSESTPGPIVINMATFIGQELFAGVDFGNPILNIFMPVIGSLTATVAVVLPSFVIGINFNLLSELSKLNISVFFKVVIKSLSFVTLLLKKMLVL